MPRQIELVVNLQGVDDWTRLKIGKVSGWMGPHKSIAVMIDEFLRAAVVYDGFTQHDCCMSVVIEDRKVARRWVLREIFSYPFQQCGLARVTALVRVTNAASADFCRRLGFRLEGRKRCAVEGEDELIFGMLRSECKWLG